MPQVYDVSKGKPATCRGCGAPMLWIYHEKKWKPVNSDGTPHHSTCPKAEDFRKPKEGELNLDSSDSARIFRKLAHLNREIAKLNGRIDGLEGIIKSSRLSSRETRAEETEDLVC